MHLVVQYDDRNTSEFKSLIRQTRQYCELNSIHYLFLDKGYEHIPPWWRKVFLVKELLPLYDSILWIDSDATIVSHDNYVSLFENKHFIMSPNPPMLESLSLELLSAPFCAGVWGVKNTLEGNAIMQRWAETYNPLVWKFDTSWTCNGQYAGIYYEQGAFEVYILNQYKKWIRKYPFYVLNYVPRKDSKMVGTLCPNGIFAVHYWKGQRDQIKLHWSD